MSNVLQLLHPMQSQLGVFAVHTELLTVTVMQVPGSCNMTTSLVADDPNAYMLKMCSPGYYGSLCSLCLLHNAPLGQPRYGRTGTLNCQKCRYVSGLPCSHLPCPASCCLCWVGLALPLMLLSCAQFCFAPLATMRDLLLVYIKLLIRLLMIAFSFVLTVSIIW